MLAFVVILSKNKQKQRSCFAHLFASLSRCYGDYHYGIHFKTLTTILPKFYAVDTFSIYSFAVVCLAQDIFRRISHDPHWIWIVEAEQKE